MSVWMSSEDLSDVVEYRKTNEGEIRINLEPFQT